MVKITSLKGTGEANCPDFAEIIATSTPDRSLFEQIAECFSDRLEEFAKYVCRDDASGQDAFQEAMISAMTNLESYRGDSPIDAWLRRIVVNHSNATRRRNGRHRPLDAADTAKIRPLNHVTENIKGARPDILAENRRTDETGISIALQPAIILHAIRGGRIIIIQHIANVGVQVETAAIKSSEVARHRL